MMHRGRFMFLGSSYRRGGCGCGCGCSMFSSTFSTRGHVTTTTRATRTTTTTKSVTATIKWNTSKRLLPSSSSSSLSFSTSSTTTSTTTTTSENVTAFLDMMNGREGSVLTQDLDAYNQDWSKRWMGSSSIVLRPQTTEEVSKIMKYCHDHTLSIVPQGGNTGLVGGGVPIQDEIVLSLQRMNRIHSLQQSHGTPGTTTSITNTTTDANATEATSTTNSSTGHDGILHCDAGCILQELQEYTRRHNNCLVPTDIGSKGSCMIGGNVSTNAGGPYLSRFGSLHANVMGLQVVLADGTILNLGSKTNTKDNTGYDLKQLFIGAEGTLGIITQVILHCPAIPNHTQVMFMACQNFTHVMQTLAMARSMLGEILAAFEFMDAPVMDLVGQSSNKPIPLVQPSTSTTTTDSTSSYYPYYILMETQGSNAEHDLAKMERFMEMAMDQELVMDGIVAQDVAQGHDLWTIREYCGVAVATTGRPYKYDIALPLHVFESVIADIRTRLAQTHPDAIVVNWGHVMDSDLHLNILIPGVFEKDHTLMDQLEPYLIDVVLSHGGSISAEHGLGQDKNIYLNKVKDPNVIATMKSVKDLFDPKGILNPGKYFPA